LFQHLSKQDSAAWGVEARGRWSSQTPRPRRRRRRPRRADTPVATQGLEKE
jgi:hypothetical protein